jgi:cytosine/adenosine deaminase-related metal-dependent hydrolase
MRRLLLVILVCLWAMTGPAWAQRPARRGGQRPYPIAAPPMVLKPARVWDGLSLEAHDGWIVVVRGQTIEAAGPADMVKIPEDALAIELPGTTLLPGLIDAHTHVLLHPYDEALWNDQVLKEALALRVSWRPAAMRPRGSHRSSTFLKEPRRPMASIP